MCVKKDSCFDVRLNIRKKHVKLTPLNTKYLKSELQYIRLCDERTFTMSTIIHPYHKLNTSIPLSFNASQLVNTPTCD